MHMHVVLDDPEKAIRVVNGRLGHLAQLLALSRARGSARRADASPRVVEADGLRRVPALGTAAAFPEPALTQPPSEE
jgi:hypothetical protein